MIANPKSSRLGGRLHPAWQIRLTGFASSLNTDAARQYGSKPEAFQKLAIKLRCLRFSECGVGAA
jgi:hypothetical protein